jgi:hypothetical protein
MELGRSNSKSDWEVWNWVGTTKKSDWEVWNLMGATKNPTRRCGTWWEQQKNPHSQTSTKKSKLTNIYKKSKLTNIYKRGNGFGEHDITYPLLSI